MHLNIRQLITEGVNAITTTLDRLKITAQRLWAAHLHRLATSPVYETLLLALLDLVLGRRVDLHQLIIRMMARLRRISPELPDPDGWAY